MTVELDRAKQVETPAETVPQQVETPVPTGLETRGALLAVCGIGGGVGTSTLAFLTAMHVQHFCAKSVLLSDTGGPGASLAVLAGQSSPLSLGKAAAAIAADALGVPLFVPVTPKLRLIAREPELDDPADTDGLARLLHDARDAHPLTIVDCGTLQRPIERSVAEQASAILWVTQASPSGARRAQATLRSLPQSADQEILAVRPGESRNSGVEHQLMSAADIRGASLVFVPALPDVCNGGADAALEAGQLALEAIRVRLT
jgi:Flp pilus assembly CpaE family ATPase